MVKLNSKGKFIEEVARRARFTKADVRLILDTMIEIFIESAKNRQEIFIYGFGKLFYVRLRERKSSKAVKGGIILPETDRVTFRLSESIRDARRDAK